MRPHQDKSLTGGVVRGFTTEEAHYQEYASLTTDPDEAHEALIFRLAAVLTVAAQAGDVAAHKQHFAAYVKVKAARVTDFHERQHLAFVERCVALGLYGFYVVAASGLGQPGNGRRAAKFEYPLPIGGFGSAVV